MWRVRDGGCCLQKEEYPLRLRVWGASGRGQCTGKVAEGGQGGEINFHGK